jgi:hypothetical protein
MKGKTTMKKLRFSLLFLLLACITISADAQTTQYRHPATGLILPDSVAGIVKGKVTDYEEKMPGLGISVAYDGPGITATVFIYDFGLESVPDNPPSATFKDHFALVKQDIYEAEKFGYYKSVKTIAEGITFLKADKTGPQALSASLSYVQNGTERLSKVYLLGHKNHFVKIRFTYDKSAQEHSEEALKQFLNEIGATLQKNLP